MWHLGTWFNDEHISIRFADGFEDLKHLFQPKRFFFMFKMVRS